MVENELLIPAGQRLLHIGPPKTGTTAIQGALKHARPAMAAHGVLYPGRERQHSLEARAVLGSPGPKGDPPVDPACWDRLVRQVSAAGNRRVVVSSEVFSNADEASVPRIVEALGGPSVHVVVTLRALARIMPSAWQQFVRQGMHIPYDRWLARVLRDPPHRGHVERFWRRHRADLLVERWASVVGTENVTVVVVDESDREMVMRVFESLVGLPAGLLKPQKVTNPSLTFGEAEFIRHLNREFNRREWSDESHRALVRLGAIKHLQRSDLPMLADQRIVTPSWAAARAAGIATAAAERIAASGVRVVGDLTTLGGLPLTSDDAVTPPPVLASEVVTKAVVGTILAMEPKGSDGSSAADLQALDGDTRRRVLRALRARLRAVR